MGVEGDEWRVSLREGVEGVECQQRSVSRECSVEEEEY